MEAFTRGSFFKIVDEHSFLAAFDVQILRRALVSLHAIMLVYPEVFRFNLTHGRGVHVFCDDEKVDEAALPTLYHPYSDNAGNRWTSWRLSTVVSSTIFSTMRTGAMCADLLNDSFDLVLCFLFV